ncbi:hypothetical protein ASG93_11330 [Paenibacillus sp. Soil787]|nr:hypothetical protein ASG93_11330 [Paenibacillus sp. Soil787]
MKNKAATYVQPFVMRVLPNVRNFKIHTVNNVLNFVVNALMNAVKWQHKNVYDANGWTNKCYNDCTYGLMYWNRSFDRIFHISWLFLFDLEIY